MTAKGNPTQARTRGLGERDVRCVVLPLGGRRLEPEGEHDQRAPAQNESNKNKVSEHEKNGNQPIESRIRAHHRMESQLEMDHSSVKVSESSVVELMPM